MRALRAPTQGVGERPRRAGVSLPHKAEAGCMAGMAQARKNPAATLLAEIGRSPVVMLGLADADDGMRPMVAHVDHTQSLIYFFTRSSGSLTAKVGLGATGRIAMSGKSGDFYAWVEGAIAQNAERATMDRLWSPTIAAWYHGKDDPDLSLLMFTPRAGKIWVGPDSTVSYALQMAKALATGEEPEVTAAIDVLF
jgi:general stress protein 26